MTHTIVIVATVAVVAIVLAVSAAVVAWEMRAAERKRGGAAGNSHPYHVVVYRQKASGEVYIWIFHETQMEAFRWSVARVALDPLLSLDHTEAARILREPAVDAHPTARQCVQSPQDED